MAWNPSKVPKVSSVDAQALAGWLETEMAQLASALASNEQVAEFAPSYAEPVRPRKGMVVYADGTSWNPGLGKGLYSYDGAVWVPVGYGIEFNARMFGAKESNSEAANWTAVGAMVAAMNAAGGGTGVIPWQIDYGYVAGDPTTHPTVTASTPMVIIDYGRGSTHDLEPPPANDGMQIHYFFYTPPTVPAGQHDGNFMRILAAWHTGWWIENTVRYAAVGDPSRTADDNIRATGIFGYGGTIIVQMGIGLSAVGDVDVDTMKDFVIFLQNASAPDGFGYVAYQGVWQTGAVNYSIGSHATVAAHWFGHPASAALVGKPTALWQNVTATFIGLRNTNAPGGPVSDIFIEQTTDGFWNFKNPFQVFKCTTLGRPAGAPDGTHVLDITLGIPIWKLGAAWINAVGVAV